MLESIDFIYKLTDPRVSDVILRVRYVGKTNNPEVRYSQHIGCKDSNVEKNQWISGLQEEGLLPGMEVIDDNSYPAPWATGPIGPGQRERHWIKHYIDLGAPLLNAPLKEGPQYPIVYKIKRIFPETPTSLAEENARLRAENVQLHTALQKITQFVNTQASDILDIKQA